MTKDKARILVVEDEDAIRLGIEENLKFEGYGVLSAKDGPEALKAGLESRPDLVILDIMLPGMSGYEVCRKLREAGMHAPVIMLTARQDEFDRLHGFEVGADDYVTKPFSVRELLARVKAILLRGRETRKTVKEYRFGDLVLDLDSRTLRRDGVEIKLTRTEFDLLAYFCANPGAALSRERVMNEVWGMNYFGTQRSMDSFVASLRAKIEHKPASPRHILTVHGVGYKFAPDAG